MLIALQFAAVLISSVAMALSLAHALEYPGKLRLSKDEYLAVQTIYYPGFTFAGGSEPLAVLISIVLLFLVPSRPAFWLTVAALLAFGASHLVYWLMTHPVNRFWLKDTELKGAGSAFFKSDPLGLDSTGDRDADWTAYRDRWEQSHIVRAVLSAIGFMVLVLAMIPQ